ncbi:MAG: hypothetical protein Q4C03_02750 [bacterium]|nr:hypothetical protein [bacterium]
MNRVDWSYFNKFEAIDEKYLPARGEGENMATQIVTATAKLVYKWYNDGDVYDNTKYLKGWCNDLSSYANWLAEYVPGTKAILDRVWDCRNEAEYENILKDLIDLTNTEEFLERYVSKEKQGSVYDCEGDYVFEEYSEDDDEEDW